MAEDGVPTIKSISSLIIDSPPSCLEFSPWQCNVFVVGTYLLEANGKKNAAPSSQQVRKGSLMVLQVEDDKEMLDYLSSFCYDADRSPKGSHGNL